MALKTFDINDGVLIDKRRNHDTYSKTVTEDDGDIYKYTYGTESGEETTEWPALTKTAAEAKVDDQPQPPATGPGSEYYYAEWEMMEDNRVVGSYILTRTQTYTRTEWYTRVQIDEE